MSNSYYYLNLAMNGKWDLEVKKVDIPPTVGEAAGIEERNSTCPAAMHYSL
jgi:hypothetical protein